MDAKFYIRPVSRQILDFFSFEKDDKGIISLFTIQKLADKNVDENVHHSTCLSRK